MISKELLSEVLNKKVTDDDISNIDLKENTITFIEDYWDEDEGPGFYKNHTINIYELAHKCKEWAKSKEFIIHSSPTQKIEYTAIAQHFDLNKFYYGQNQFYALSEYEAIFKACEYVLKELNEMQNL